MINPSKCQSNTVGASMTSDGGSPSTVSDSWNYTTNGCPLGFGTAPTMSVTPSHDGRRRPGRPDGGVNSNANNPTIKRVQLTMPSGVEINPAFANGLNACSTADINADNCNPADAIATVSMTTPLLDSNPTGNVYLETPGTTATTRYRVAMIIDLPGRELIVRGSVTINGSTTIPGGGTGSIDSGTGQIIADFDNIPDLGFTNLTMTFDAGDRAMVVNPSTCSAISFQGTITPHSGGTPASPTSGYTPTGCSSFFTPTFTASVDNTQAAASPEPDAERRQPGQERATAQPHGPAAGRPRRQHDGHADALRPGRRHGRQLRRRRRGRFVHDLDRLRQRDLRPHRRQDLQRRPEQQRARAPAGRDRRQRRSVRPRQAEHPDQHQPARRPRRQRHDAAAAALRGHRRAHPHDADRRSTAWSAASRS